jgi:hypothetical protein
VIRDDVAEQLFRRAREVRFQGTTWFLAIKNPSVSACSGGAKAITHAPHSQDGE